jgi:hypothetical protein
LQRRKIELLRSKLNSKKSLNRESEMSNSSMRRISKCFKRN